LRTSPPRRNTLPPAAEFPPDFEHIFSGTEPLDSEPSRRILETPEGLMEMLGTQSLQQQDDDEIRPVPHAGEASARPPLPVRPTSPQLIDLRQAEIKTKNDRSNINFQNKTLIIIKESAREALQNPTLRQALQAEGIALYTNDLDAQGRLVERERELTPLLEAAANKASTHLAGLSDADMSRLDRAVFMAAIIREQLGQVMAVSNPPGSGESIAPQVSRRLGQPAGSAGKARAISEGGHLHYLAAAYAGEVLELNTIDAGRLRQRATGVSAPQRAFQLNLRDLSEHQTPSAVALVHKLYPPAWVSQQAARKNAEGNPKVPNTTPMNHRQALIAALLRLPEGVVMQQLRDAAANPDPDAMATACKEIEDAASQLNVGGTYLRHALMRLQGHDYEPAHLGRRTRVINNAPDRRMPPAPTAYAGAPPADEALRWLKSKAPASA
jgi:hypothetical protein